jgi:Putative phage tail protein
MIGGKNQGAIKPTAMGSMLQASTYGATIPTIIGQTQSPLLAIWAANLRQGGSTKKFKQMKKGITTYVENIDFLLGHSPIMGVLQMMVNGGLYPLNFTSQSFTASGGRASFAVSDSNFYYVIAVTLEASYSFAVNDYGAQGPETLTGSYEIPLWNELETGPDPTDPMSYRCWPFCYRWQPGYGATVNIDAETFPAGTLKIYYAQLTSATSHLPPIQKLHLAFESELGSGSEYADAGSPFSSQQIIYPHFAGLGSSEVDLGSGGAIPQLLPEVRGKWGVYPTGDADFADMIEDVFKSGVAQAAIGSNTAYTQMERGLSSYDLPGTVQKKVDSSSSVALPPMLYDMPNTPGNILICVVTGSGSLAISSSASDVWTPIYASGLGYQVWYAVAVGGQNTVTVSGAGTPSESAPAGMGILEIFGVGAAVQGSQPGTTWAFAGTTNSSQSGTGSASVTQTTANLDVVGNEPPPTIGDDGTAEAQWSNFILPTLPPGAVVTAIEAVLTIHTSVTQASFESSAGEGLTLGPSPEGTIVGSNIVTGGGTDPATAATLCANWALNLELIYSLDGAIFSDSCAVTFLALRVSYTVSSGVGGLGGSVVDAISTTSGSPASAVSTVEQNLPGYLLNINLFPGGAAPAASEMATWKPVTPANFCQNAPSTFEVQDRIIHSPGTYASPAPSVSPASVCLLALKCVQAPSYPAPLGDFIDLPSLDLVRAQCRANGLYGSLSMNSQSAASDWLKTLYAAANATPVFLGSKLYSFPYSEVSAAGNGATYTAPTAAGPVANLDADNGDFVGGSQPITVKTASRVNMPNVLQMQCVSRSANYNQVVVSQPDAASIALYGVRKADPIVNNAVQDASIARQLLAIQVRRNQYGGDVYSFTINSKWSLLAPMDLITVTDRLAGIVQLPVRITSMAEQDDGSQVCDAEPFIYGMCAPSALTTTAPAQNLPNTSQGAGNVNAPVIFEPVPRLYGAQNQAQLWVVVSSSSAQYGGCQVYISTDGGNSYNPAGDPLIGSAITGVSTADWPAAADPDTTNNLALDLTESNGVLQSYQASDRDNFLYPCYVAGGGSYAIAYELMTYNAATLTAANKYTLEATGTGNELRRGVFAAPAVATGVDHPSGSRFAFLPPSGAGILKLGMDPTWIGKTLYFKIVSFNTFGGAAQSLSDVTAYSYTPTGAAGAVNPGGLPAQGFQVNGA